MEEMEVRLVRLCPNCGSVTEYDADLKCKACGQHTKEEVIAGELPGGPPGPPMAWEERPSERRMRRCREHGKEIDMDARICQYCGVNIPDARVSENMVTGLAAILGIFGLNGIGHIVLGRMAIGFLIFFAGLALIGGIIACAVTYYYYTMETAYWALIAVLAAAYIFLFVWQVMDANASARKYNLVYENHKVA
jgi:hypothetical protein